MDRVLFQPRGKSMHCVPCRCVLKSLRRYCMYTLFTRDILLDYWLYK